MLIPPSRQFQRFRTAPEKTRVVMACAAYHSPDLRCYDAVAQCLPMSTEKPEQPSFANRECWVVAFTRIFMHTSFQVVFVLCTTLRALAAHRPCHRSLNGSKSYCQSTTQTIFLITRNVQGSLLLCDPSLSF